MKTRHKLSAALCILLCFALLAVPPLAVRLQDARLADRALERPPSANKSLELMMENPFLYALYETTFSFSHWEGESADAFKQLQPIKTQLDKLVLHGVLPEEARETVLAALEAMDPDYAVGEQLTCDEGFATFSAECQIPYTEEEQRAILQEMYGENVVVSSDAALISYEDALFHHTPVGASATYHKATGLVNGLTLRADGLFASEPDCDAILEAYRAYLGLDDLGDWYDIQYGDPPRSPHTAFYYQPDSRVFLHCAAQENSLFLVASVYTEDLLAAIQNGEDDGIIATLLPPAA